MIVSSNRKVTRSLSLNGKEASCNTHGKTSVDGDQPTSNSRASVGVINVFVGLIAV